MFDFDGELVSRSSWGAEAAIREQLLYTIGHLNEQNSVGRLDKLVLSDAVPTRTDRTSAASSG